MLNLARSLASHKLINLKPKYVHIDNLIFRCHYRVTVLILLIGVALLSSQEYIGEYISCIHENNQLRAVINRFCFFMATFTVVKHHNRSVLNREIAHPGVGPYVQSEGEEIIRHTYYQWVIFVLFLQAVFFYLPHVVWREMEQGKLKGIIDGMKEIEMVNETYKKESFKRIELHLKNRLYINRSWALCLIFCELLNLLNLILQVYLTDVFLGYHFWDLGTKIYWDEKGDEFNPLDVVFPKVTKCSFQKFGPSGSIQHHDIMCIMALNIVNEKIYLVLWFWYIFLFIASVLALIWRFATFFLRHSLPFNRFVFNFTSMSKINEEHLRIVMNRVSFGEWIFLSYLAGSMNSKLFDDLLSQLAESYNEKIFTSDEKLAELEETKRPLVEFK
ncbi:hypothetical protein RUM43_010624 [Polyplax serrata]|uniref:Innexin n=1 Tax=Polyplax serrata TaxID=468196 RepID=A0AAN8PLM2_POLSC